MNDKYFFKGDEVFVLHDNYLYNLFPSRERTIVDETLPSLQGNFFLRTLTILIRRKKRNGITSSRMNPLY